MKNKRMAMIDTQRVFDTYITFQIPKEPDGPSLDLDDYDDYISLWAESRFLRGRNLYAARVVNVKTDVEFIIRYRDDIDETMRIKIGEDKFYNIEGILPLDNSRGYMAIKAYEIKRDM